MDITLAFLPMRGRVPRLGRERYEGAAASLAGVVRSCPEGVLSRKSEDADSIQARFIATA